MRIAFITSALNNMRRINLSDGNSSSVSFYISDTESFIWKWHMS